MDFKGNKSASLNNHFPVKGTASIIKEGNCMIINHNMSSINANNLLKFKVRDVTKTMEKLSSGMRINRGGDDASGLAVSEKMRSQIRGLLQAERNIQNGVSFIQATEGYLQESQDIVHRIRELSVQAANGIYSAEDRMQIQVEVDQLVDEVNRIASHAQFNGMNMLTGRFAENSNVATMFFHVGANMNQREIAYIGTMTAGALGLEDMTTKKPLVISNPDSANRSIGDLDEALKKSASREQTSVHIKTDLKWHKKAFLLLLKTCRLQNQSSAMPIWHHR
jgi:flagellin